MATFTHTTTWLVNIDGRSTVYSFSYEIADVIDVQRVSRDGGGTGDTFEISSEPVCVVVVGRSDAVPTYVTLTENGTPSGVTVGYLRSGEMYVSHLSDSGGTWNSTGVNNTATLQPLDSISIGGIGSSNTVNYDLMILHQAAS